MRMVEEIKEYSTVTEGPVDISCWISNTLLDIMAMLTANRDHDSVKSKNQLHPALTTLNDTMAFSEASCSFRDSQVLSLGVLGK